MQDEGGAVAGHVVIFIERILIIVTGYHMVFTSLSLSPRRTCPRLWRCRRMRVGRPGWRRQGAFLRGRSPGWRAVSSPSGRIRS